MLEIAWVDGTPGPRRSYCSYLTPISGKGPPNPNLGFAVQEPEKTRHIMTYSYSPGVENDPVRETFKNHLIRPALPARPGLTVLPILPSVLAMLLCTAHVTGARSSAEHGRNRMKTVSGSRIVGERARRPNLFVSSFFRTKKMERSFWHHAGGRKNVAFARRREAVPCCYNSHL